MKQAQFVSFFLAPAKYIGYPEILPAAVTSQILTMISNISLNSVFDKPSQVKARKERVNINSN